MGTDRDVHLVHCIEGAVKWHFNTSVPSLSSNYVPACAQLNAWDSAAGAAGTMTELYILRCVWSQPVLYQGISSLVTDYGDSCRLRPPCLQCGPWDPLFHFPLNQLVGIGYVASSLTLLALSVSPCTSTSQMVSAELWLPVRTTNLPGPSSLLQCL